MSGAARDPGAAGPPEHVPSPCVKVCALDPESGLCRGCFRTLQEIADWLEMTSEQKRAALERAAQRARAFDVT